MDLNRPRVTEADLEWWLKLAPTLTWTFAKTYAETAPHSYIVHGRTRGLNADDYIRAARVIRVFGQPGKFYNDTNIYLTSPDGQLKWWTMNRAAEDTGLVNQATTDLSYGEQNAPSTVSGIHSAYDEIAPSYDRLYSPVDGDERVGLLRLLSSLGLGDAPTTLDIGCGTGAVLDLGITSPDRYVGVDPSQGMLNELVIKHSRHGLGRVIPMRIEDAVADLRAERFDLVIAAFGSSSYLTINVVDGLRSQTCGAMVLMSYGNGYRPSYSEAGQAGGAPNDGEALSIGKFDVVVIGGE